MSFGAEIPKGFYAHQIKKGESLRQIAPSWAWDTIMRVNRIDGKHLRIGQTILIPLDPDTPFPCPVPMEIESAKAEPRSIQVFVDIQYFGAYEYGKLLFWGPVSTAGKGHRTPLGAFRIALKDANHFSHDKNCYGAPMHYALNLSGTDKYIHEQVLPGWPDSHGCVRALQSDAIKLFSWTKVGDLIVISD